MYIKILYRQPVERIAGMKPDKMSGRLSDYRKKTRHNPFFWGLRTDGDPADRLIVATTCKLPLATRNAAIRSSRAVKLWKA